ncbi:hypothetical protein D9758_016561 [Tetrapyrgos nigripes]|uniref:Uncharacterized protein n=1 Tax=Tetrapyrgos nigripes TaxID=182062 RepID=A0A8H5FD39_9AGAR|nr:hypothetical protein D9758_016561 [Tetrapyrgos nigripes]
MLGKSSRRLLKDTLRFAKIKLVYSRITLTKWTTLYFFVALLYCIVLVVLQGITLSENTRAVGILDGLLQSGHIPSKGLVVIKIGNALEMCRDLPSQPDSDCSVIDGTDLNTRNTLTTLQLETEPPSKHCLQSLIWLDDTLRDSMREDIVTLIFHIWLFLLSFAAILNESLPHLGAALAGHVLVTAWAGYRLRSSRSVQNLYNAFIVQGPCGTDFLGDWWSLRQSHTWQIPVITLNVVGFLLTTFFSVRLYKVYAAQTFKRVGASRQIHTVYKLVLLLSVCLQLAGFFAVASTGMWIDKASTGVIKRVAKHLNLYRAVFCTMAALELPWVILGWRSVRKEQRRQFIVFWSLSLLLLIAASAIFASPVYIFIFQNWPFFANMTIVSYVLTVATTALGIVCRIHFGRGLPEFLKEKDELEGADFAPVYISFDKEKAGPSPVEKRSVDQGADFAPLEKRVNFDIPSSPVEESIEHVESLAVPHLPYLKSPEPTYQSQSRQRTETSSVYSDIMRDTIKLSSTPPVAQAGGVLADRISISTTTSSSPSEPTPKIGSPSSPKSRIGLPSNPKIGRSPSKSSI